MLDRAQDSINRSELNYEIQRMLDKLDEESYDRRTDVADIYEEITALRDTINALATQISKRIN